MTPSNSSRPRDMNLPILLYFVFTTINNAYQFQINDGETHYSCGSSMTIKAHTDIVISSFQFTVDSLLGCRDPPAGHSFFLYTVSCEDGDLSCGETTTNRRDSSQWWMRWSTMAICANTNNYGVNTATFNTNGLNLNEIHIPAGRSLGILIYTNFLQKIVYDGSSSYQNFKLHSQNSDMNVYWGSVRSSQANDYFSLPVIKINGRTIGMGVPLTKINYYKPTPVYIPRAGWRCIAIRSRQWNTYFVIESDGDVYANKNSIGSWEKFMLTRDDNSGNYFIFSTYANKFLQPQQNGQLKGVNLVTPGSTERFVISPCDGVDDCYSFKSQQYNKYMAAEGNSVHTVNINRGAIGSWERFQIIPTVGCRTVPTDCVAIKSRAHNKYVVVEDYGAVNANRGAIGSWEKFDLGYDFLSKNYYIQSKAHNKFFQAQSNGALNAFSVQSILNSGRAPGNQERFRIWGCYDNIYNCWSFKSEAYNKYMVAESNGQANVNRDALGSFEKFQIISTTCNEFSDAPTTIDFRVKKNVYALWIIVAGLMINCICCFMICCFKKCKSKKRYKIVAYESDEDLEVTDVNE